ncbi:hypothetical protein [Corynebacterium glaucum]|uniref:hypothetical protein n=1 Tax=Corynebacterium glaucum TaxID=187491 RepID=UPI000BAC27B8|nr:hypothetical protein [Corynebacterium glaucum]
MAGYANTSGRPAPVCQWCGKELAEQQGRGRRRKFCGPSCKQRAYEQRHNIAGTSVAEGSVILRPERVAALRDELYELRCAAEDIRTAAEEDADAAEIRHLCDELVEMALQIEKLR